MKNKSLFIIMTLSIFIMVTTLYFYSNIKKQDNEECILSHSNYCGKTFDEIKCQINICIGDKNYPIFLQLENYVDKKFENCYLQYCNENKVANSYCYIKQLNDHIYDDDYLIRINCEE